MKTPVDYNTMSFEDIVAREQYIRNAISEDSITPHDVGLHIARLSERAFRTGEMNCIEIILSWSVPNHAPMYRAWVLWSLLRSGFLGTFEKTILSMLETEDGRQAIRQLICGAVLTPESAGRYMLPAMENSDIEECLAFIDKSRPWIPELQQLETTKFIFTSAVSEWKKRNKGSWD